MTASNEARLPQHIAIIMDGNNRFAKKKQLDKGAGHREGKNVLDPIVEHCRKLNVQALTVFAFSSENWNRPQYEVDLLMQLLGDTIREQIPRMEKYQIALRFIGERERLSLELQQLMLEAELQTADYKQMTLTIAISYGGMWDIANTAKKIAQMVADQTLEVSQINTDLFSKHISLNDLAPVDLLIRTGGDYRLSNFLLWQTAYAELYFTQTLWPEFTVDEFDRAIQIFSVRERRFGQTSEQIQQANIEK